MATLTYVNPASGELTKVGRRDDYQSLLRTNDYVDLQWDDLFFEKYKKFWFAKWIESMNRKPDIANDTWKWSEIGKIYEQQVITDASVDVTVVTNTVTVKTASTTHYFVVSDIVDLGVAHPTKSGLNLQGRVTAVAMDGGFSKITCTLTGYDNTGGTISVTDFVDGGEVTLVTNSQTEAFTIPDARYRDPKDYNNQLNKIATASNYSDDASNTTLWFKNEKGTYYWVEQDQMDAYYRHRMDVDNAILFGQKDTYVEGGLQGKRGDGIISQLDAKGCLKVTYASTTLTEDNLIDILMKLAKYAKGSTFDLICGFGLCTEIQKALKHYTQAASNFLPLGLNEVGINITSYTFGSRKLRLMEYGGFSDPHFLPQKATTTNAFDYDKFGIILDSENKNLSLVYRKNRATGKTLKDLFNVIKGVTFADGEVSSETAAEKSVFTTSVGVELKGGENHGMLIPG